ncbi:MAG: ribosome-associated translation inhibitor RaiA [Planctomycetota bacterium]|nr:MAG: ribosome-associated translation inhibitor RaiA [Planctomycetota bacterium]
MIGFIRWFLLAALGSYEAAFPAIKRNARVQIHVSARHGHLSPASQSKITAKVARLKRYFDRLTALNVTVDLKNSSLPTVEIVASAEHYHDMVSHELSGHLWRSVDGAVQKLEQQLRKHKEKVRDHKHVENTRWSSESKEA